MKPDHKQDYLLQNNAIGLTDLFAAKEGRRPRILIGGKQVIDLKKINVIANNYADLGCNVDIAPLHSDLTQIAKQSIENDVDIVLIVANEKVEKSELNKFQEIVFEHHPGMLLSLCQDHSIISPTSETELNQWVVCDQGLNSISIALKLLNKLLQISE